MTNFSKFLIIPGLSVLLLVTGFLYGQHQSIAEAVPPPQTFSQLYAAALSSATEPGGSTISDVAEKVVHSVVNISSEKIVQIQNRTQPYGPFFNDPFFRHFFGDPYRHHRRPTRKREKSLGSGVIISEDGVVLTNNHVIEHADKIKVTTADGTEYAAEVVGVDPETDLGVLRLQGNLARIKPIPLGDSNRLRLGETVLAVGNPFGIGQTVTKGIVSAKSRANMGIVEYEDFIQTDAAINPGNSGGALVNTRGQLIGINTAILSRSGGYQGIGFAIPTHMFEPIVNSLLQSGKVTRGWLGVSVQEITPDISESLGKSSNGGVLVTEVQPNSPAADAGLATGDIIVKIGNTTIQNSSDLRNQIALAGGNRKITMLINRNGENTKLEATLVSKEQAYSVANISSSDTALGGLTLTNLNDATRKEFNIHSSIKGVIVKNVESGTAGDKAGFRAGDVIRQINRRNIENIEEFEESYRTARDTVLVLVQRQRYSQFLALRKS